MCHVRTGEGACPSTGHESPRRPPRWPHAGRGGAPCPPTDPEPPPPPPPVQARHIGMHVGGTGDGACPPHDPLPLAAQAVSAVTAPRTLSARIRRCVGASPP